VATSPGVKLIIKKTRKITPNITGKSISSLLTIYLITFPPLRLQNGTVPDFKTRNCSGILME
jgi:hypothetical protein